MVSVWIHENMAYDYTDPSWDGGWYLMGIDIWDDIDIRLVSWTIGDQQNPIQDDSFHDMGWYNKFWAPGFTIAKLVKKTNNLDSR